MYKIKQIPEDFIVKEILKLNLEDNGEYCYLILRKRNWTTLKAIRELSKRLRISTKRFGFAGLKDKNAITEQYVSVFGIRKEDLENIKIKDIDIKFIGYGKERINLGSLEENRFSIIVRNLDKKVEKIKYIPNYYDEQRFGIDKNNHLIGKALVKRNFKQACEILKLNVNKNNYIGALRTLSKKRLLFYIHSYQSYLFNKTIRLLKTKHKKLPLIGFLTEPKNKVIIKILKQENIEPKDFIIKQMPELSSEGNERPMFVKVKDLKIKYQKDELNSDKYKAILNFTLPKGSYGTIVVKELFNY